MSEKISDVVLRFNTDGEIAYSKTIKSINKEMNIAAAEYKNQVTAMDKNATQTEKLTATKQKLEKQMELAGKRTELLREEYEKSVQETGRYSDQSQKLYKQLLDSEAGEQTLKTSLEETNKELKKQGNLSVETAEKIQQIEKAGEKVKGVGKSLSIGVTAPIMAAKAASVKAYEDMRQAQAKLINQTGAIGAAADEQRESLRNLYRNSAKDAGELADALGTVTQRFDVSGKAAEDMTLKFLTFARVNNTDAATSIEKVSRAMADANIETSDYEEVLDLLTVASKKTGIGVDELAESLTKYGAPMKTLGIDTKEAIAIFSSWEQAGVSTEKAFSGMQIAIKKWASDSKDPIEEFPKAMEKIKHSTDPTKDAIELFGKSGTEMAVAITEGRFDVEEMTEALENADGMLDKIAGETGNPMSKMIVATHRLNDALLPFGQIIVEAMVPAVQKLAEFMEKLNEKLNGMDDKARKTIIVIGMIVASIGPLLLILGTLMGSITKVAEGVRTLQNAWTAMSAVFEANPFILTIIAIAALVAALVWAYNNVEWFHDGVNAFFQGVSDVAVEVFNFMAGYIGGVFEGILVTFQQFYDAGTRILTGLVDFITGVFTGNWAQAWEGVVTIFGGIWDGMVALAAAPINIIIGMINGLIKGLNAIQVPKWVPGVGGKGVNISEIPYLANGGHLINGQAIVGEAGPELLTAKNGKTTVTPLSDNEKRAGIGGKQDGKTTVEQHIHFGKVDANNPSELAKLNRQMYQAGRLSTMGMGGV